MVARVSGKNNNITVSCFPNTLAYYSESFRGICIVNYQTTEYETRDHSMTKPLHKLMEKYHRFLHAGCFKSLFSVRVNL